VERSVKQFPSLASYFKSKDESQARFRRLQTNFTDSMTEVYLMFFQSVLPCFTHCNQFLHREGPLIHVLQPQLEKLLKKILAKFIKPAVIAEGLKNDNGLLSVDFKDKANHVTNSNLVIGYVTKQTVQKLLKEGISGNQQQCETVFKVLFNAYCKNVFCKCYEPLAYILGLPHVNGSATYGLLLAISQPPYFKILVPNISMNYLLLSR